MTGAARFVLRTLVAMATGLSRCELIDLTMSSPDSTDIEAESGSDESVILTEVIRYLDRN